MIGTDLSSCPIHLGLQASAQAEPPYTGTADWYEAYGKRHEADGYEGRLMSLHAFAESWPVWEMHPHGSEVVLCTGGRFVIHQELSDGSLRTIELEAGQYAINDAGIWHTFDLEAPATALFVTAGWGTQHRPR